MPNSNDYRELEEALDVARDKAHELRRRAVDEALKDAVENSYGNLSHVIMHSGDRGQVEVGTKIRLKDDPKCFPGWPLEGWEVVGWESPNAQKDTDLYLCQYEGSQGPGYRVILRRSQFEVVGA